MACRAVVGHHSPKIHPNRYSIASDKSEGVIEIHIQQHEQGQLSQWLSKRQLGEKIELSEPAGQCIYQPKRQNNALLCIGHKTGLAPLVGVIKSAIASGHQQPIYLIQHQAQLQELYYIKELKRLCRQYPALNILYACDNADTPHPKVSNLHILNNDSLNANATNKLALINHGVFEGEVEDLVTTLFDNLQNTAVYLAGQVSFVQALQTFLIGYGVDPALLCSERFNR